MSCLKSESLISVKDRGSFNLMIKTTTKCLTILKSLSIQSFYIYEKSQRGKPFKHETTGAVFPINSDPKYLLTGAETSCMNRVCGMYAMTHLNNNPKAKCEFLQSFLVLFIIINNIFLNSISQKAQSALNSQSHSNTDGDSATKRCDYQLCQ